MNEDEQLRYHGKASGLHLLGAREREEYAVGEVDADAEAEERAGEGEHREEVRAPDEL